MKREAVNHTKMKRLCRRLDLANWQGVGLLESIWHLAAGQTPRGDLGKLTDEDIALGIDYRGDESKLIAALISAGWLETHPIYRLVIHDWPDHADDAVNMRLARAKLTFVCGCAPKWNRLPPAERASAEHFYANACTPCARIGHSCAQKANPCSKPSPQPSPLPQPQPSSSETSVKKNGTGASISISLIDSEKSNGDESDDDPERALRARLIRRHGDSFATIDAVEVCRRELEKTGLSLSKDFLAWEAVKTTAPTKIKNPGGHYRSLAREFARSNGNKAEISAVQAQIDAASEPPPKPTCPQCRDGQTPDGGLCGCKAGRLRAEVLRYQESALAKSAKVQPKKAEAS